MFDTWVSNFFYTFLPLKSQNDQSMLLDSSLHIIVDLFYPMDDDKGLQNKVLKKPSECLRAFYLKGF